MEVATIQAINQTTPIQVIVNSDPTTTYIALTVAAMTAIALVVNLIMQRKQLKAMQDQVNAAQRQVELMDQDMQERVRAWLGAENYFQPHSVVIDGDSVPYQSFVAQRDMEKLKSVTLQMDIKNYGSIPAQNCRYGMAVSEEMPSRDSVEKLEIKPYHTLMPNAKGTINLKLPADLWVSLDKG